MRKLIVLIALLGLFNCGRVKPAQVIDPYTDKFSSVDMTVSAIKKSNLPPGACLGFDVLYSEPIKAPPSVIVDLEVESTVKGVLTLYPASFWKDSTHSSFYLEVFMCQIIRDITWEITGVTLSFKDGIDANNVPLFPFETRIK
jgi:hypothetical protein